MNIVFFICFGAGLVFAVISAFIADMFGTDRSATGNFSGAHWEDGSGASERLGLSPRSPTMIGAFVTGFGGFGLLFNRIPATAQPVSALALATLAGLVVAGGVYFLFKQVVAATRGSTEAKVAGLEDTTATVIAPIPEGGVGEIAYVSGGWSYTAAARSEDGMAIESGVEVRITRIAGVLFHVRAA